VISALIGTAGEKDEKSKFEKGTERESEEGKTQAEEGFNTGKRKREVQEKDTIDPAAG